MAPDRSWMWQRYDDSGNFRQEFKDNVELFIQFAVNDSMSRGRQRIKCPCANCENRYYKETIIVKRHIYEKGFVQNYTRWIFHGEDGDDINDTNSNFPAGFDNDNPYVQMVVDGLGHQFEQHEGEATSSRNREEEPNEDAKSFYSMLRDAEEPLWDGCLNHSTLSAVSHLLNKKAEGHVSGKAFDDMIQAFCEMLPEDHKLPKNYYRMKKKMGKLGLGYEKIDSCINNCMLYYRDDMHLTKCRYCDHPRFQVEPSRKQKGIPFRVLRYLPIIPRLKRLYMSTKTAPHMTWHHERPADGEKMSHPSDSEAWKEFSRTHRDFADEPRNVRLGLCTDGFTPFNQYGQKYSCWPVILTVYNLPPWMCMKEPYMFLNMVIPGPTDPGNNIDVFFRPLVDELKQLWLYGVPAFDSSRKQNFTLHAALLWTISDLPAYAMLSGWGTSGKLACPYCLEKSNAFWLKNGGKVSHFDCHRKFLPQTHPFREQRDKFRKGVVVTEGPPPILSGDELFDRASVASNVTFGTHHKNDISGYGLSRQIRSPPENNIPTIHESIDEVQYQHMTRESYIAPEPCARDTQTDLPGAVKMAKRVRGPTKMKQKGRRESWEPLIQLEFNEEGEVKSDNATTFANFCGVAVRKYAPLQLKVWEDVPFNSLELIFQKINKHYQIPNDRQVLDKLLKSLGKKYRAYRTRLKSQYFDVHKTNALRLSHRPKMINEEDWVYLVALFSSDEFQVASNRNENNRKKYKGSHRAGTSSFAKVESMMKRTEGASPGKYRLYEKTHKPANGDPMNVHSNEIMEKAAKVAKERGVDLDTAILNVLPSSKKKRKVLHFIPASCNSVSEEVIALQVGKERADNRAALAEKLALEAMHDAAVAKERARLMEINLAKAQLQNFQALKGQGSTRGASSRVQVVDSDATTEEPSDSEGNNF